MSKRCRCCPTNAGFCCSAIPSACFIRRHWVTGAEQLGYDFESFGGRPWWNDVNRVTASMSAAISISGPGGEYAIDLEDFSVVGKGLEGQIHPVLGCTGNPPDAGTLVPDRCVLELPRCQELADRWHATARHYFPIWRKESTTIVAPIVLHAFPIYLEGGWQYGSGTNGSWSPASHVYAGLMIRDQALHSVLGSPSERLLWDGMLDAPEALDSVFLRYEPERYELEILVLAIELAGDEETLEGCEDPIRYFRPFGNGIAFERGPVTLTNSGCPAEGGGGGPGGPGGGELPPCTSGDGTIEAAGVEISVALGFENEWRTSSVCGCRRSLPERCPSQLSASVEYERSGLFGGSGCGGACSFDVSIVCGPIIIGPKYCCGVNDSDPFIGYGTIGSEKTCPDGVTVSGTLCAVPDGSEVPSCLAMITTPGTRFATIDEVAVLTCGPSWVEIDGLGDWPAELGLPRIKARFGASANGTLAGDVVLPIATWSLSSDVEAYAIWNPDDPDHLCPTGSFDLWARTSSGFGEDETWQIVGSITIGGAP